MSSRSGTEAIVALTARVSSSTMTRMGWSVTRDGLYGLALLVLCGMACACTGSARNFNGPSGGGAGDGGHKAGASANGGSGGIVNGRSGGSGNRANDAGAAGDTEVIAGGSGGMGDVSALSDGTACKVDGECTNGHCIDGVCCATACAGCDACAKDLTGKDDGTCAPVVSGKDPHDLCSDETATTQCGNDGTCDGKGACRKVGAGRECSPAGCSADGKKYTPAATCDGAGKCASASGQDCAAAQCTLTNGCLTSCTSSTQCMKGFFCDTAKATCTTQQKNGVAATDAGQCASGVIADGVCCDKPCTGCSACTLALNYQTGSAADGQCLPVLPGKPAPHSACPSGSSGACGPDGTCDGANACRAPAVGATCASTSCTGSTLTTSTCDSSQKCTAKAAACPSSLACNTAKTGCLQSCAKDGDCAMGFCVGGTCAGTKNVGDACGAPGECPNGYCVDGYCCSAKCDGDCQSCSQTPGQCKTLSTPRTSCTGSGTCGKKYCDGSHASCVFPGAQTACPNQCSSDWGAVLSSSCDGAGSCGAGTPNSCNSSQYCSTSNNQCTSKISSTATACTKDIQCTTGKCCSTCVNASTDNNNCGGCGTKCGANKGCQGGTCACSGYTFPANCGSTCGSWSFESGASGTEGWSMMTSPQVSTLGNGALNAVVSTNRPAGYPGTGSYSLVVPLNVNGSTTALASVGVQFCQSGKFTSVGGYVLSGYVYFSGTTFPSFASFAAYTWGANDSQASQTIILLNDQVAPNTWIHFQRQMDFGFQYDHLALALGPNGSWNGTMYLDDIQFTGL